MYKDYWKDFKNFKFRSVRELRLEKGMTQLALARKSHLKRPHLSQVETGKINMTWFTSIPLAEALKENPLDLMLGQSLENWGLDHSQRLTAVKMAIENPELLMASKSINRIERLDFGDRDSFGRVRKLSTPEAKKSKDNGEIKRNSVCAILTEKRTVTFYNERYDLNVPKIVDKKTARLLRKTGLFKFEKMRDENQRSDQKG